MLKAKVDPSKYTYEYHICYYLLPPAITCL